MRAILALLLIALPLSAAKKPTTAQLQAQVKRLVFERTGDWLRLMIIPILLCPWPVQLPARSEKHQNRHLRLGQDARLSQCPT